MLCLLSAPIYPTLDGNIKYIFGAMLLISGTYAVRSIVGICCMNIAKRSMKYIPRNVAGYVNLAMWTHTVYFSLCYIIPITQVMNHGSKLVDVIPLTVLIFYQHMRLLCVFERCDRDLKQINKG